MSIRDRLRTDRVGILMSGGIDSPTLAATALGVLRAGSPGFALHAFTSVYDRLIPDEERYYAGLVASHLDIPIHYDVRDDETSLMHWGRIAVHTPEPVDNPAAVAASNEFLGQWLQRRAFSCTARAPTTRFNTNGGRSSRISCPAGRSASLRAACCTTWPFIAGCPSGRQSSTGRLHGASRKNGASSSRYGSTATSPPGTSANSGGIEPQAPTVASSDPAGGIRRIWQNAVAVMVRGLRSRRRRGEYRIASSVPRTCGCSGICWPCPRCPGAETNSFCGDRCGLPSRKVLRRRKTALAGCPDLKRVEAAGFPELVPSPDLLRYVNPCKVPTVPRTAVELRAALRPLGLNYWLNDLSSADRRDARR